MADFLLFHVYGALASWGDVAVGETRPTHAHPTRSAILGLVAGALGVRRNEELRHRDLSQAFGVAVLICAAGDPLRDYHTTQTGADRRSFLTRKDQLTSDHVSTILSTRDYRSDALYRIALWRQGASESALNDVAAALERPVFAPYLGRKSCPPALPFEPRIVSAETLAEALSKGEHQLGTRLKSILKAKETGTISRYVLHDPLENDGLTNLQSVQMKDRLINRSRWQFGNRTEIRSKLEECDVF